MGGGVSATITSGASAIWSFNLLKSDYTGKCIRIQRQSDNAQTDISFSAGKCSKSEVDTFTTAGAVVARIVTFYDQSGNTLDLTAANATAPVLTYDSFISNYNANFQSNFGAFFTMPAGLIIATRTASLYLVNLGRKANNIQAFFDFTTNKLMYYQNDYNSDSVYDGIARVNPSKYVPYSVDYNVVGVRSDATNVRRNFDNLSKTTVYSSPVASSNTAGGSIGKWSGAGTFAMFGFWTGGIVYNKVLSDTEDTTTVTALLATVSKTVTKTKVVICSGDSMTYGVGATTLLQSWPILLHRSINDQTYNILNTGISGAIISDISSALAAKVTNLKNQEPGSYSKNICILWVGTNDINAGTAGATAFAAYKSLAQSIMAAGISVIAVNIIIRPAFTAPQETQRLAFNAAWLADQTYATSYFDADAVITAPMISGDNVHINDLGHSTFMTGVKPLVTAI